MIDHPARCGGMAPHNCNAARRWKSSGGRLLWLLSLLSIFTQALFAEGRIKGEFMVAKLSGESDDPVKVTSSDLNLSHKKSGEDGAPYAVAGEHSLEITAKSSGKAKLTIDYSGEPFDLTGAERFQMEMYVTKGNKGPSEIMLSCDAFEDLEADFDKIYDRVWFLITWKAEAYNKSDAKGPFELTFDMKKGEKAYITTFRLQSLIPNIFDASGHEKRVDLRWDWIYTWRMDGFKVERSDAGKDNWKEVNLYLERPEHRGQDNVYNPCAFDYVGKNDVTYDYRVSSNIRHTGWYTSDVFTVTSKKESDDEFIDSLQYAASYRWIHAQNRDVYVSRSSGPRNMNWNPGGSVTGSDHRSVGAHGFDLGGLPAIVERGWFPRKEVVRRIVISLRWWKHQAEWTKDGFMARRFNIFGEPWGSIYMGEMGFFATGLLIARQYFDGSDDREKELRELCTEMWEKIDWTAALNHEGKIYGTIHPSSGKQSNRLGQWNEYSNTYLLAIASPTHPIPAVSWTKVRSVIKKGEWYGYSNLPGGLERMIDYEGFSFFGLDPRIKDDKADYSKGIRDFLYAQREYCIDNPKKHPNYGKNEWGLGRGYLHDDWRGDVPNRKDPGSISPLGLQNALPFAPEIVIPALRNIYNKYEKLVFTPYGWYHKYNIKQKKYSVRQRALEGSPTVGQIENYRTGLIWSIFMSVPEIQKAIKEIGINTDDVPKGSVEKPTAPPEATTCETP